MCGTLERDWWTSWVCAYFKNNPNKAVWRLMNCTLAGLEDTHNSWLLLSVRHWGLCLAAMNLA